MNVVRRVLRLLVPLALLAAVLAPAPSPAATAGHSAPVAKPACQRTLPAYPILRPGDRSAAVRTLQCSLNDVGVGPVAVDGFYGPQTKAAVKEITDHFEGPAPHPFRINNGMWTLLFGVQLPDSDLALGAHGSAVTVLQRALRAAGAEIVVDGTFGKQTERVVKAYQREMRVHPATGVVNEQTRFFLGMGGVFGQLS
jgi:peptidoglycan hydrolase-like protein with peptidoglycan-binding domain